MKVYNIRDSREFFEKLAACEGIVEVVQEDGARLPLMTPMTCFEGAIREMELFFQNQEDCTRILRYLMNKRNLAA